MSPVTRIATIHDELQRTELRRAVEDALDERRVIGAAAFGHIAVELRPRLAGDDDAGIRGWRGVQRSQRREQQGGEEFHSEFHASVLIHFFTTVGIVLIHARLKA